jgi:transposase
VIARDRSSAYAEGARQGVSEAIQVAGRFHLFQNLAEVLDEVFTTHHHVLQAVNAAMRQQPVPLPDGTTAVPVPPPVTPPRAEQQASQRAARRQALYEQVWTLHRQGWTVAAIAATMGAACSIPIRRISWSAGTPVAGRRCSSFESSNPRGYTGSYRRVAAYASRLRHAQGLAPRHQGRRQRLPVVAEPACQPLTPRRTTWVVLRREVNRTAAEAQQLTQLHAQSAEVAEAIDLAQDFTTLVRQRQPAQLEAWLTCAATSTLEALRRFATGLYEDHEAVKAGVTLPWSTGPVEGHINRLKMVKRQMFGRARLDLLSRRFLWAPRERQAQATCPREPAQAHSEAAAA